MAIEIEIKQTRLFKAALTEEDLCPAGLQTGHWNHAGVLDEGPDPGGRVVYDPRRPGRGCYVSAVPGEKERAALRQNLTCTPRDLEVLYSLTERICRAWKTDRFEQDGAPCRLSDIPRLKEEQRKGCQSFLSFMARQWEEHKEEFPLITGAVFPLYLEQETAERMREEDSLDFFAGYLEQKQAVDCYYAKPNFFRHNNGVDVLGVYSLTEGVDTILPAAPFVPPLYRLYLQDFTLKDEEVTQWQVALGRTYTENGQMQFQTLGYVPFDRFARWAGLETQPRFDARHVRVCFDDLSGALEQG